METGHCKELNAEQINNNKERDKQAEKGGKTEKEIGGSSGNSPVLCPW